jgi:hypothetical protein
MGIFLGTAKMENRNKKIESFFSQQLNELKATYSNKFGGRIYTEPNKEKALERCLELADFDICLEDIQADSIICKCNNEKFAYVCVNPSNKFFFVVSVCNCEGGAGK